MEKIYKELIINFMSCNLIEILFSFEMQTFLMGYILEKNFWNSL
jgi:hypothetical protein